jgi:hypothetical protein
MQAKQVRTGAPVIAALVVVGIMMSPALLPSAKGGGPKSDSKVKVKATAGKPDSSGTQIVTVTFDIDKGWHIYGNPVGNRDLEETRTEVKVSAAGNPQVKVEYPPAKIKQDKDVGNYRIYDNRVNVRATVHRSPGDSSPLEVSVRFNACNESGCLPPASLNFKVK